MSEKGGKQKTNKNNKKATKDKKPITLRLNDGTIAHANTTYKESTWIFRINGVDIGKIKASDKKLYSRKHVFYVFCIVFYEHNDEHIPLKFFFTNVTGRYYSFTDD